MRMRFRSNAQKGITTYLMLITTAGPARFFRGMSVILQPPLIKCDGASVCVPVCSDWWISFVSM